MAATSYEREAAEVVLQEARESEAEAARAPAATAAAGLHRIVIVGGGAGGLVLAAKLGHALGRRGQARATLIDANLTHVWKPLLHEVATGTLDSHKDDVIYLAHAKSHHFSFQQGRMVGLDRGAKRVLLAPVLDDKGQEVIP